MRIFIIAIACLYISISQILAYGDEVSLEKDKNVIFDHILKDNYFKLKTFESMELKPIEAMAVKEIFSADIFLAEADNGRLIYRELWAKSKDGEYIKLEYLDSSKSVPNWMSLINKKIDFRAEGNARLFYNALMVLKSKLDPSIIRKREIEQIRGKEIKRLGREWIFSLGGFGGFSGNKNTGFIVETDKEGRVSNLRYSLSIPVITKEMTGKYKCPFCGYIYAPALGDKESGIFEGTGWNDLPGDWVCPKCGTNKDAFEAID